MNFLNSIFYKSIVALYRINTNKDGRSKSFLIDAIWRALLVGKDGLDETKLEMALKSASGSWLNYWGNFYGVYRNYEEEDDAYRERIIEEIVAPKNTKNAIQKATARHVSRNNKGYILPEEKVYVFEPWTQLLKLDSRGHIDGDGRIISYDYWNYGVIDIAIPEASLITADLIEYLKKIKAAGVKIVFSLSPDFGLVSDWNKEERDHNIITNILQEYYIYAQDSSSSFQLMAQNENGSNLVNKTGSFIDQTDYLDGSMDIFWEGVLSHHKAEYATGVIRNHLGSAVINLSDFYDLSGNPEMTIKDAIKLEQESTQAIDRLKEGKLTRRLDSIDIATRSLTNVYKAYIRYVDARNEDFIFDSDNIGSYLIIDEIGSNSINDANDLLLDPTIGTNETNIVKKEILERIGETNINSSAAYPLLVSKEETEV